MAGSSRRPRWHVAVAAVVAGVVASGASAQASPAPDGPAAVRPSDERARSLVGSAVAASPTVAALVNTLASSDVIVLVQVSQGVGFAGDLRMMTTAGGSRILLVRVNVGQSRQDQIAVFGHELQHASEVAQAPEVQDEAGLARLMARIGRETGRGTYETDAAVQVGRLVRQEAGRR